MSHLQKVVFAATLALGSWGPLANAQDKHTPTISNCTVIDKSGAYQVGKVIEAATRDLITLNSSPTLAACFVIAADFVTLDLGGNAILGPATPLSMGIAGDGRDRHTITIRNGAVSNFGLGIFIEGEAIAVEHVHANRNERGILIDQGFPPSQRNGNRVVGNTAVGNSQFGMVLRCPAVVRGNVATGNAAPPPGAIENPGQQIQTFGVCTRADNYPLP